MFKSNRTNQLLKIAGLWTVYLIVMFTGNAFSYSNNRNFFIIITVTYILLTLYSLWRIKHPSKKARAIENEG